MNANISIIKDGTCRIDNIEFPAIGIGTYTLKGEVCRKAVKEALEIGYRIIDTATFYDNFKPIGEAIKSFPREGLHIISKVWHDNHHADALRTDIKNTLEQLGTHYIDSYLLHWPNSSIPIDETLYTMQELKTEGLIRHIGMCNVNVNHLIRALEFPIPIAWVQIEMNPFFYDPKLLGFCHKHGIGVQAWRPLGGRDRTLESSELLHLSEKYRKSPAAIALQWIIQHQALPLPGSQDPEHIQENFDAIGSFEIKKADMELIDSIAMKGQRKRLLPEDNAGFTDEFDFSFDQCWPKSKSVV